MDLCYSVVSVQVHFTINHQEMIDYFLKKGVNVNYHEYKMGFTDLASPVIIAARKGDMALLKKLVEHGADITYCDRYGLRAYRYAVTEGHQEMADYIKELEPIDFHLEKEKEFELSTCKIPKKMVSLFKAENRRIPLSEPTEVKWIELRSYLDLSPVTHNKIKFLPITSEIDGRPNLELWWNVKDKGVYLYEKDSERLTLLAKWKDFFANPDKALEVVR